VPVCQSPGFRCRQNHAQMFLGARSCLQVCSSQTQPTGCGIFHPWRCAILRQWAAALIGGAGMVKMSVTDYYIYSSGRRLLPFDYSSPCLVLLIGCAASLPPTSTLTTTRLCSGSLKCFGKRCHCDSGCGTGTLLHSLSPIRLTYVLLSGCRARLSRTSGTRCTRHWMAR
jgi:hypothetical protein